jgi:hypothetical protein
MPDAFLSVMVNSIQLAACKASPTICCACARPGTRRSMRAPGRTAEPIAPLPLKRERAAGPPRGLLGTEPKPLPSPDQARLWTMP